MLVKTQNYYHGAPSDRLHTFLFVVCVEFVSAKSYSFTMVGIGRSGSTWLSYGPEITGLTTFNVRRPW